MTDYLRALLRFWWVLVLGVFAGLAFATVMVYRVHVQFPPTELPKLERRAKIFYTARTELLIDSPTGPYLRAGREVAQPQGRASTPKPPARTGAKKPVQEAPLSTSTTSATPAIPETILSDRKSLVEAANLFPLFIEGDEVRALREKMIGTNVEGQVKAKALYSLQAANRFRPSVLPVIQISSESRGPKAAIKLTQATAAAFAQWLETAQKRAKVAPKERIVVRELRTPKRARPSGGTDLALPFLGAMFVFSAFVGLAIVLDRSFPRRVAPALNVVGISEPPRAESVEELVELVQATLVQLTNGRREPTVERASESAK